MSMPRTHVYAAHSGARIVLDRRANGSQAVQDIAPILPLLRGVGDEARVMEAVDTNQLLRHARKKLDFLGTEWQAVGASGQPLYPAGDKLEVFSQLEACAADGPPPSSHGDTVTLRPRHAPACQAQRASKRAEIER